MEKPYRAEVVGSLLRPRSLMEARGQLDAGKISVADFKHSEDGAVDNAIALQEEAGLDVVTDGEMRRLVFFDHYVSALEGLSPITGPGVPFHGENPDEDVEFQSPLTVTDKIQARRRLTVEEFSYARGKANRPIKVTLPSPLIPLFTMWSPTHSRDAYPDPFDLLADLVGVVQAEVRELVALGCEYIQVDAPELLQIFADEDARAHWESLGIPPERVFSEGVDMVNAAADVSGVTRALHLCKGNYQSKWIARGGYEEFSQQVFDRADNYDVYLFEYDDERSGSFAPLANLPEDKVAVLGLVSSKRDTVEQPEAIIERLDEASRYFPREQMALSTQCGFASDASGNLITDSTQRKKLELVAQVAHRVWG